MPTAGIRPRNFRYPDDKWERVQALAKERHTSASAIIVRYLDTLIAKKKRITYKPPAEPGLPPKPPPERVVRRIDPATCQHLNVKVLAMGHWCRDCGQRLRVQ